MQLMHRGGGVGCSSRNSIRIAAKINSFLPCKLQLLSPQRRNTREMRKGDFGGREPVATAACSESISLHLPVFLLDANSVMSFSFSPSSSSSSWLEHVSPPPAADLPRLSCSWQSDKIQQLLLRSRAALMPERKRVHFARAAAAAAVYHTAAEAELLHPAPPQER